MDTHRTRRCSRRQRSSPRTTPRWRSAGPSNPPGRRPEPSRRPLQARGQSREGATRGNGTGPRARRQRRRRRAGAGAGPARPAGGGAAAAGAGGRGKAAGCHGGGLRAAACERGKAAVALRRACLRGKHGGERNAEAKKADLVKTPGERAGLGHVWLPRPAIRRCAEEAGRASSWPGCGRSLLTRFVGTVCAPRSVWWR